MTKRKRKLPPMIRLWWNKRENDLYGKWEEGCSKRDIAFMFHVLDDDVRAALEKRGFDLTTLRFQIRKKDTRSALERLAEEAPEEGE